MHSYIVQSIHALVLCRMLYSLPGAGKCTDQLVENRRLECGYWPNRVAELASTSQKGIHIIHQVASELWGCHQGGPRVEENDEAFPIPKGSGTRLFKFHFAVSNNCDTVSDIFHTVRQLLYGPWLDRRLRCLFLRCCLTIAGSLLLADGCRDGIQSYPGWSVCDLTDLVST
jgi:hypothetical protein